MTRMTNILSQFAHKEPKLAITRVTQNLRSFTPKKERKKKEEKKKPGKADQESATKSNLDTALCTEHFLTFISFGQSAHEDRPL